MIMAEEGTMAPHAAEEDPKIISRVLTGERNAYAEIVFRHEGRIRAYCTTVLRDSILAEDAAQEIFIKAYQALGRFRGEASFSTWLYRIAVNHCRDILRKMSRVRQDSWERLLEEEGEKIEAFLISPKTSGNREEQLELLSRVLSCLPEKSRVLLVLREMHGLSYEELAAATQSSLDSVKSRLKRARQEMEKKMRHFFKGRGV